MAAPTTEESRESTTTSSPLLKRRFVRVTAALVVLLVGVVGYFVWYLPHQQVAGAEAALRDLRFEDAERHLTGYPAWGLDLGKTHFLRARMNRHQSGYAAALEHLRLARAARYDDDAIDRERTLLQIQNGQPASSQANRIDAFCEQAPEDRSEIFSVFANGYLREGKPEEVNRILDRWSKELPGDGRADYTRGVLYQRVGNEKQALDGYRQAVQKSPRFVDGYLALARTHAEHWRYEQAVDAYQNALKVAPQRLSIKIALGKALWILRRGEEAVEILEPITKADPTVFPAGLICARYYLQSGKPQRVISILEPMLKTHPDDASLNYMFGAALHQTGDKKRSKAALEKFFAANKVIDELTLPIDVPQSQYFAELLRRGMLNARYDWEQSIKWLNMAARAQPNNPVTHELLAQRYRENGTPEQALRKENIAYSLKNRSAR